jgi:hypothetical protein
MFGKFSLILPMFGKMFPARGGWICQCLAKWSRFCQTLAKRKNRAAKAARPKLFPFLSFLSRQRGVSRAPRR